MSPLPSTRKFYKGKTIFLTGATGYVGRFLVYKMLKEYDVNKIYILLRGKGRVTFEDRFNEYKSLELFTKFLPDKSCLSKIVAFEGDICQVNCGLTEEQQNLLKDQVDIVIHSAASIRFTAPLKSSVLTHIDGTRNVVELAANWPKVEVFIHVSSLSAWMNYDTVPESIPDCPYNVYEISARFKDLFEHESLQMESEFIGARPKFLNSYSFTKSLAEVVIDDNKHRFKRVAIIRPPFLVSSNADPMTGWFDEPQEGVALAALFSLGLCRIAKLQLHQQVDALPVDVCVNALLAITWYMVVKEEKSTLKIFNLSISNTAKCTGYDMLPYAVQLGYRYPSTKQIRPPVEPVHYPATTAYISIKSFFTHTLFAILVDFILFLIGRKPMLYSLTKKKVSAVSKIFQSLAEYKQVYACETQNIDLLYGEKGALPPDDRQTLFYDLRRINWFAIAENGHLNFRRRVLKESDDTLPFARKRLFYISKIYRILTHALQLMLVYLVYKAHLMILVYMPCLWPFAFSLVLYLIYQTFINVDPSAFTFTTMNL